MNAISKTFPLHHTRPHRGSTRSVWRDIGIALAAALTVLTMTVVGTPGNFRAANGCVVRPGAAETIQHMGEQRAAEAVPVRPDDQQFAHVTSRRTAGATALMARPISPAALAPGRLNAAYRAGKTISLRNGERHPGEFLVVPHQHRCETGVAAMTPQRKCAGPDPALRSVFAEPQRWCHLAGCRYRRQCRPGRPRSLSRSAHHYPPAQMRVADQASADPRC